ncbi:TolB family protein [Nubsella zeaxanthinifaciens]|uniref:TolB family protein n=1 Tax=Nubsella zeaxanthinifaciens TaxID=392412 RepID=UPI003D04C8D1
MKIKLLTTTILSFTFLSGFAQFFDESQTPLSVKWRQIEHGGFKIIYPATIEKDAQRMANTFARIYPTVGRSLTQQKTLIPVVLQNQGTTSNGFVQLAPKKSQFYTISPQQFDSQDWLNNLAVHELRHVAQFNKITGTTGFPFPEEVYFGYLGLSTPIWFLEGDAVSTETELTYAGRGRQPNWIMPFRASLLEGKNFSYSKSYFGSEKDVTAGYYQLGYLINSQLQKQYGPSIGNQILSDINQRPLRLYPFSQSLKKITGKNTNQYYLQTLQQLRKDWQQQDEQNKSINYPSLNQRSSYATSYHLPTALPNGDILCIKQSKSETPRFVIISPNKKEKLLLKIGYQEQPWFSYAENTIVWEEQREDPRYKQRSYNVICTYDLQTGKLNQLTHKTRLFAPSISANGKNLIAVNIDLSNHHNLVMLDLVTGKITDSIPNPANDQLQTPSLNADGSEIAWIAVNENGKSLWVKNNGKTTALISNTRQQISRPIFFNGKIAFNAHYSGIDNVYELDPANKKISALTASKYGAFNPSFSADGKTMLFNNYQLMGFEIAKTDIKPTDIPASGFVYYGMPTKKEDYVFESIPDSTFTSTKYSPLKHAFNFHSISPTSDDAVENVGLQLKSNDLLNTTSFYTGITYQSSLRRVEYSAGLSYRALYPVFNFTYRNRPRLANYRFQNTINQAQWREDYFGLTANLPLSFNSFNHRFSFVGETGTYYVNRHFNPIDASRLANTIAFPMTYRIGFNHQLRSAERDIAPRWAQVIDLKFQNLPFDKNLNGKLFAFESYFYFPGFAKNHTFLASFNYQQNSGTFASVNDIPTVYGYNQVAAKSLLKNSLLLNYRFPFLFPDLEIGSLAYIRNVRAGLFSHYENIGSDTNLSQPKTFGLEIKSDMNLLRYQPVADVGARLIFVNKIYNQNPIFELLFNYYF